MNRISTHQFKRYGAVESQRDTEIMNITVTHSSRYYYLKDHLGNIRVTVNEFGQAEAYNDYYPFGLQMPGRSVNNAMTDDIYKFGGKELDEESGLNWYYFGARDYDPAIGRFPTIDRFAGLYPSLSPYQYGQNNPIYFIEVNGDSTRPSNEPGIDYEETDPIVATAERYEASDLDPFSWVSLILFGNDNYYEIAFNKEKAWESIPNFLGNLAPGGTGAVGISTKVGKRTIMNPVGRKALQKGFKHLSNKIIKQMKKRGWTENQIREALQTKGIATMGKNGSATRFVHPTTGKSVVIDNSTGEIFHVGGKGFKY